MTTGEFDAGSNKFLACSQHHFTEQTLLRTRMPQRYLNIRQSNSWFCAHDIEVAEGIQGRDPTGEEGVIHRSDKEVCRQRCLAARYLDDGRVVRLS